MYVYVLNMSLALFIVEAFFSSFFPLKYAISMDGWKRQCGFMANKYNSFEIKDVLYRRIISCADSYVLFNMWSLLISMFLFLDGVSNTDGQNWTVAVRPQQESFSPR